MRIGMAGVGRPGTLMIPIALTKAPTIQSVGATFFSTGAAAGLTPLMCRTVRDVTV